LTASDQWFCVADPGNEPEAEPQIIAWRWPFGRIHIPTAIWNLHVSLRPLELQLRKYTGVVSPSRPGLVIADCSCVMRWVVNPESEVDFETRWVELSGDAVRRVFGSAPIANVCVYDHSDMETLSSRIDVLDTLMRLFGSHTSVATIDSENRIQRGSAAIAAILRESRPSGVSSAAWRGLTSAAAVTLARNCSSASGSSAG